MSTDEGRRARGCGCAGCVGALLAGGTGLVLFGLGLMPATTEALPFGIGLVLLGLCAAIPSGFALFRGWAAGRDEASAAAADTTGPVRPPSSITCPACGGSAPLALADPTHTTCAYCHQRFALPPDVARALSAGSAAVSRQSVAERQMAATVASLAQHERSWKLRLAAVVALLFCVSALVAVVGFLIRETSDSWHGFFAFGSSASLSTLVLGLVAAVIVPSAVRRVVGGWSAIRLPGEAGLGCRVCGGPLPSTVAPVLRCSYCSADNLADTKVLAKVAASARQAEQSLLAVSARKSRGDELAAQTLRAFPLLVALVWFAVGAASGSVVFVIARDVEIWPNASEKFALIRVNGQVCLGAAEIDGDRVRLFLSSSEAPRDMSRAELARYSASQPISAAALEGRQTTRGRIASVYRPLNHLGMHRGRLENGSEIYFPNVLGAGERICLVDVPVSSGPEL